MNVFDIIQISLSSQIERHLGQFTSLLKKTAKNTQTLANGYNFFPPYLRAVVDLLIEATSNKAIATTLALQERTVRSYVSEIIGALRQSSRSELAITAIKAGFR